MHGGEEESDLGGFAIIFDGFLWASYASKKALVNVGTL